MPVTYTFGMEKYLDILPQALQSLMSGGSPTRQERKAIEWLAHEETLHSVLSAAPALQEMTPGVLRALRLCLERRPLNYFEGKILNRLVEVVTPYVAQLDETLNRLVMTQAKRSGVLK